LPSGQFDFVWGEDAWCYVEDKARLIAEAARLLRPGGVVAFTDWMEGPSGLSAEDAERFFRFMKFPNVLGLEEYASALKANACAVRIAMDTGRFAGHARLYIDMVERQLTYDALKILGFDQAAAQSLPAEMRFMLGLAESGKIIQGLIVAQKLS
jgi:sarcosine/dimethylglycine N-methyltransferase